MRKLEDALAKGDFDSARIAFADAEPELRRGVSKGVVHLTPLRAKSLACRAACRRWRRLQPPSDSAARYGSRWISIVYLARRSQS